MKKRVILDLDGVVVDLLSSWFDLLYQKTGTRLRPEDITTYYFPKDLQLELEQAALEIVRGGRVFIRAKPIPGALYACRTLVREGFDVRFATMALTGAACAAKVDWVRYHLKWGADRIMLTHAKDWLSADYAVDDCPNYLRSFASKRDSTGPTETTLRVVGFPHPYNRSESDLPALCDFWAEPGIEKPEETWTRILDYIIGGSR